MEMVDDGSTGGRDRTTEEEDLILRSVKKPKGVTLVDDNMDDFMLEKLDVEGSEEAKASCAEGDCTKKEGNGTRVISYKDKLLRLNEGEGFSEGEADDWKEIQRKEEEEDGCDEDLSHGAVEDPLCPVLRLSKSEHKGSCKQWRKALIIKLMGKKIGTRFLMARLQRLWNLVSTYELIDLDNGFLLLRFHDDGDYVHVLEEGPWVVADHYIVVQRWFPFFDPYDEDFRKLAVNSLRKNDLGDVVITERAKFARICVEVDLRKTLLSKFTVDDKVYQVGYEGIHLICFKCGVYGHRKDKCDDLSTQNQGRPMEVDVNGQQPLEGNPGVGSKTSQEVEEAFGSWMVVQKPKRGGKPRFVQEKRVFVKEEVPVVSSKDAREDVRGSRWDEGEGSLGSQKETGEKDSSIPVLSSNKNGDSKQSEPKGEMVAGIEGNAGAASPKNSTKSLRQDSLGQKRGILKDNRSKIGSSGSKLSKAASSDHRKGEVENLPPNAGQSGAEQGKKPRAKVKSLPLGGYGGSGEEVQAKIKGDEYRGPAYSLRGGVGKKEFPALIKDLKFRFKISILALVETRISGCRGDKIIKKLGFNKSFKHEAVGFAGGIWLLWDDMKVKVEIAYDHNQYIHTRVVHVEDDRSEFVTFVYGNPRRLDRQVLWERLELISQEMVGPWIVLGDFNSVQKGCEKVGGKEASLISMNEMNSCLMNCELEDIGFKGPNFTWKRGILQERLDRACANEAWVLNWPNRFVTHLPFLNSDRRPILLAYDEVHKADARERPFKFLASWMTVDGFEDVVRSSWNRFFDWGPARNEFERRAKDWHHSVYRLNMRKKNNIYARLRGIDNYRMGRYDHSMEILQRSLWKELQEILVREELDWFQRSRCQWLKFGDKNTKFFHSAAISRRRHNKVIALKDEDGNWVSDKEELCTLASCYFEKLFAPGDVEVEEFPVKGLFPILDNKELD
ncbi:uncharacterized protein LOC133290032 [Gastrolobium bilobum]|uniref:uncharacterized protein LOC133290032 n=1 Tax=Gastrolobium bilobum TaxID=150636 RepID=UPI002AB2C236|nr:uncharacterized protein LOC133290032 [Gastrolobium bilobum]